MNGPHPSPFLLRGELSGTREESSFQRVPYTHLLVQFLSSAFHGVWVGDLGDVGPMCEDLGRNPGHG